MSEKSQNGWKASKDPAEINIKSYPVPGTTIKLRCAAACAPILVAFAAEFHELVEPIDEGTLDDWGYAYRPVRGQTEGLSNHSSGTAIDLNAKDHSLGKENTFNKAQQAMIQSLIKKYSLVWGGNYKRRKDDMHFEIKDTPEEVEALIKKLKLKKG